MMDQGMKDKFLKIAKSAGLPEETLAKITEDLSKGPAVVAVSVTKTEKPKLEDLTDEAIDKMSEDELKSCLKSYRDAEKSDDGEVPEKKEEPKPAMNPLQEMFSKVGY